MPKDRICPFAKLYYYQKDFEGKKIIFKNAYLTIEPIGICDPVFSVDKTIYFSCLLLLPGCVKSPFILHCDLSVYHRLQMFGERRGGDRKPVFRKGAIK